MPPNAYPAFTNYLAQGTTSNSHAFAKDIPPEHSRKASSLVAILEQANQWSAFERTFMGSETALAWRVFAHLDPVSLLSLGRSNARISLLVALYKEQAWDIHAFLSLFLERKRITAFRLLLKTYNALVFGPAVLSFFDRRWAESRTMDVVVTRSSFDEFSRFLVGEGYIAPDGAWGDLHAKMGDHTGARLINGDKATTRRGSHQAEIYLFARQTIADNVGLCASTVCVVVHVVNCAPYEHVLAQHSSASMQYFSFAGATSLFPKTTYKRRLSLISIPKTPPHSYDFTSLEARLYRYALTENIRFVGMVYHVIDGTESGRRYTGDSQCWNIPFGSEGVMGEDNKRLEVDEGPRRAFDVLEWPSGVAEHGAYMKISEPYVWR